MKTIKKFNFSDIDLKKIRKNSNFNIYRDNSEKYVDWALSQLKQLCDLDENKIYDATNIFMNKANIEKLRLCMDSWLWLEYSPSTDNDLFDDEYSVELEKIMVDKNYY